MPLDLDDVQRVVVGDEQVGLPVGCTPGPPGHSYSHGQRRQAGGQRELTKGQRQTAPLHVLGAAPPPVRVHEHTELWGGQERVRRTCQHQGDRSADTVTLFTWTQLRTGVTSNISLEIISYKQTDLVPLADFSSYFDVKYSE